MPETTPNAVPVAPPSAPMIGVPMPLERAAAPAAAARDGWLRVAVFCILLGALLTALNAWLVKSAGMSDAAGMAAYREVVVPLLAGMAVAGVLMLERAPTTGMLLCVFGALFSLAGDGIWLLPGTVCACIWAVRHKALARTMLGFLLLIPGIAAGYYGIVGTLAFVSGTDLPGLPPGLSAPLSLAQAVAPLELLPVAVLGAWLLIKHDRR
ncbi:MAG TPA: hypothetical protein VN709_11390 [Terriglobales bacterium]|nr:hypothetical protein [Terriglobales bacterium]